MSKLDPIALYIVVRESLAMGMGKGCAQSGHAVEKVIDLFYELDRHLYMGNLGVFWGTEEEFARHSVYREWKKNGSRKITLVANEKEWEALKQEYGKDANIVIDAGITDLVPGTETMMAFWPRYKSARSKSLKRLRSCE